MLTVGQIDKLIFSSRPVRRILQSSTLALLGLSMLFGAMMASPDLIPWRGSFGWLVPQIVLIALIVLVIQIGRRQRQRSRLMIEGFEAVQLRQWDRARELFSRLLRRPIRHQAARAESLLALASVAEADHAYDASQRIYESLLEDNAADPIQLHTARVAMAAAMLRTDQTTDAVTLIDQLVRMELPEPLRAQVELLSLFREVTMGHGATSVEKADERRALFRKYLGTRAGYGYGLLAAAFDRADRPNDAQVSWRDATLLVPPEELVERFRELESMAGRYPAAENPL